jgi:protein TonB
VIKPHEHQLVWYSFRQRLPDVTPPDNRGAQPPAAELKTPGQTIISNPKQGEQGRQMIWRPLPQIKPQPEIASPNILAFRMPAIPPPPPGPPRKVFIPPPSSPRKPPATAPLLPEPPRIQAKVEMSQNPALAANLMAALENRPKPRNFVPPVPKLDQRAAARALPEAPGIATTPRSERVPMLAENIAAVLANKPKPRAFIPPAPAGGGGASSGTATPALVEAPSLDLAGMPSASVNVAVVGLDPAAKLNGHLPDTSRDARFSAGPNANGSNGRGDSAPTSTLSVPGLLVRGGMPQDSAPANPLLIARAAPTSRASLEAAARTEGAAGPMDPPATEIHLAPPPNEEFNGRDVYTLAVQMPNISSYVGSWIMWFAERTPALRRGGRGLRAPVPLHKVDPKYLPAAIAERIEGKVQLAGVIRTNGHVDLLRVLKGVDPRLDSSAEEALLKWEFEPAERNGTPVEVDLVAEIPFLLAPRAKP